MYSYHIFYFPFKWDVLLRKEASFSERINLDAIRIDEYTSWERVYGNERETEYLLYNEKNYFYSFVHPVLYDTGKKGTVVQHYERKEVKRGGVKYLINVKAGEEKLYELEVDDLVLNLYSTGVGILVFYLKNEQYRSAEDVLQINQFGRRIFPPFLGEKNSLKDAKERELADYIAITGLNGAAGRYREDFSWYDTSEKAWDPAKFIQSLVLDLSRDFVMIPYEEKRDIASLQPDKLRKGIVPAVDDRMFVASIIFDDTLSKKLEGEKTGEAEKKQQKEINEQTEISLEALIRQKILSEEREKAKEDADWKLMEMDSYFWYRYVFVDVNEACIHNHAMRKRLMDKCTYFRWQEYGTLYGYSKYSFVVLTNTDFGYGVLLHQFRTMYSRMLELALVQRASVLKFSGEVTRLSNLHEQDKALGTRIRDLYREYIRFVNQIYFREVTAQEQGIELYQALQQQIHLKEQVESLDAEIGELHQYATLLEDRQQNDKLALITKIGGMFLIPSLWVGYFGMNVFNKGINSSYIIWMFTGGIVFTFLLFYYLLFACKKKNGRIISWVLILLVVTCVSVCMTYFMIR